MIIGIYDACGFNIKFDETSTYLGGSETWLLEISKALSNLGYEVFLFCNPPAFHTYKNIHFISKSKLKEISSIVEFDKFVFSRGIEHVDWIMSKEFSVILHDNGLTNYGENEKLKMFKNVFLLSEWQKSHFQKRYGHSFDDKLKITFNGINLSLYKKTNKTNSMVWSTCFERGLDFFVDFVFHKIKREVPDFELKLCSYNDYNKRYNGIAYLGKLSKEELASEQCKAKIWCYPNLGYSTTENPLKETFCITAVENAAAGNCILTTDLGGLGTTCRGVDFLSNEFYSDERIDRLEEYGTYLSKKCIDALNGKFFTCFDVSKFTWENAAKDLLC